MADQLTAAKENAERVLSHWESLSPELKTALAGLPRGVVADMMAMSFVDGVRFGVNEMMTAIREEHLRTAAVGRVS